MCFLEVPVYRALFILWVQSLPSRDFWVHIRKSLSLMAHLAAARRCFRLTWYRLFQPLQIICGNWRRDSGNIMTCWCLVIANRTGTPGRPHRGPYKRGQMLQTLLFRCEVVPPENSSITETLMQLGSLSPKSPSGAGGCSVAGAVSRSWFYRPFHFCFAHLVTNFLRGGCVYPSCCVMSDDAP